MDDVNDIVDWVHFEKSRAELGPGLHPHPRLFSRGRRQERRRRSRPRCASSNTVALVIPAHTLKGEARQFGAEPLADRAELIEQSARISIETHSFPDELVVDVVELRKLWNETIELFDKATNPLLTRAAPQGAFGRKVANQGFGRI